MSWVVQVSSLYSLATIIISNDYSNDNHDKRVEWDNMIENERKGADEKRVTKTMFDGAKKFLRDMQVVMRRFSRGYCFADDWCWGHINDEGERETVRRKSRDSMTGNQVNDENRRREEEKRKNKRREKKKQENEMSTFCKRKAWKEMKSEEKITTHWPNFDWNQGRECRLYREGLRKRV